MPRLRPRGAGRRGAGRRSAAGLRCQDARECTPNSGDTAWMLTSVALVLMMTIPGLGLFYGGMVRKKNVGDTVMTSFAITCLVTIIWVVCTYSHGVPRRHAIHRRARSRVPARHPERHLEGHRQSRTRWRRRFRRPSTSASR